MKLNAGYALLLLGAFLVGCGGTPDKGKEDQGANQAPVVEPEVVPETKPGMVMLRVKKAPLRGEVLPMFEAQAGVVIKWTGTERQVSIRMINPMEWREALELVCQFTRTHVATDYQGRLILKDGYGGTLTTDSALLEEERRRQGRATVTESRPTASSSDSGSSGGSGGAYRETVDNTRGSGGSTNEGVKYNDGRKPGSIFDSIGGVTHH